MIQAVSTVNNVQRIQWTKKQLDDFLYGMLGSDELVSRWWTSPNKAFDDRMPKDVYYQDPNGRQEVSDYINAFACGDFL